MGLGGFFLKLFGGGPKERFDVEELARRLEVTPGELRGFTPSYHEFSAKKRGGGRRRISAPDPDTMALQRLILRRLLRTLSVHMAAKGFERGESIVTNALPHAGRAIVVRMDLVDFFPSTDASRVRDFFRRIGWDREASELLVRFTTQSGGLPQGAPTSPRLANLVNLRLDARLAGLADRLGAAYTRYADDLTFSFASETPRMTGALIRTVKEIVTDCGYRLHTRKKLRIRRRHQRQLVTGLVVNDRPRLPRETRRWLRAVEHRRRTKGAATITDAQLAGWRALVHMIEK